MDFNQGFAIMHDRCVCTPPSGREDCSQVQTAGGTPDYINITAPPQQLRQLGEVRRQPPRLVPGEQLGRRAPTGFLLEIKIRERLPGGVAD